MCLVLTAIVTALAALLLGAAFYIGRLRRENDRLRKVAENEAFQRAQLAEAMECTRPLRTTGLLCNGVTHDFNNSLTAILGYSDMAREQLADRPELVTMLKEISKAGQNARDVTRRLLAFSRHAKVEIQLLPFALVLRDLHALLRAAIPSFIEIKAPVVQEEGYLLVDFNQLLKALIAGSVFFVDRMRGQERGVITLAFTLKVDAEARQRHHLAEEECLALTLSAPLDGLSSNVCSELFTPFSPAHRKTPDGGLDLAATRNLLAELNGAIQADLLPDTGLTFTLYLPCRTNQSL
ncbi:MAG: histidine kinase dimerization/phospho-acceptor domain-containing protein [Kiritimatiellae bacterium]|nr:histidine kinase dimerization/phospho-acceptor domain-containing protein [Kiritimatiellia bacterium]